jgi:hypothetical protein
MSQGFPNPLSLLGSPYLREILTDRYEFFRFLNRMYFKRLNTRRWNADGVNVFDEDWDNLFVLDACRYDMFREASDLPGRLESRISRGSNTMEFVEANFDGRDLRDTVYVTANPMLYRIRDSIDLRFHAVENVWDTDWDEEYRTVVPELVNERASAAYEQYPEKRIVVHYIQPHIPFLSDGGKSYFQGEREDRPPFWDAIQRGDIDISTEQVWEWYCNNLHRVLSHVEDLLETFEGRSVVTADHGNHVGERVWPFPIREWGHPYGIYTEELVRVPWHVYENGERRSITRGDIEMESNISQITVDDRLTGLGYL